MTVCMYSHRENTPTKKGEQLHHLIKQRLLLSSTLNVQCFFPNRSIMQLKSEDKHVHLMSK